MPNIGSLLKQEIARLSRREIRGEVQATKKASAQYRRHIAALRRQVAALERQVATLQRRVVTADSAGDRPPSGVDGAPKLRFVANGLRSQRARLGLTAGEFAKLAGVSEQTIYNWEHSLARPRDEHLAVIAELRGLGKRAARSRLDELSAAKRRPARKGRSRNRKAAA